MKFLFWINIGCALLHLFFLKMSGDIIYLLYSAICAAGAAVAYSESAEEAESE